MRLPAACSPGLFSTAGSGAGTFTRCAVLPSLLNACVNGPLARVLRELRGPAAPTFRALQARCDGVSSSVLTERLRELGEAGIVRHGGDGYALTTQGRDLLSRLAPLDEWAARWRPADE
jgi:hypothetical protein